MAVQAMRPSVLHVILKVQETNGQFNEHCIPLADRRDITIVAQESTFAPDRIEVTRNDLVRVTLKGDKLPRTFAIDAYRISKRVAAGQSITFEFHANIAGTFSFYCNLTSVPACRDMKGTLVVTPR